MFAASIAAPIAVPCPIRLCSSSMNRITSLAAVVSATMRANALLVLAAVRRAGEQRDVVERQQAHVAQRRAARRLGGDALREPLGDRRLADAGRPDERRVVLAVPQQDVDDARDFVVAAAHRLEAAGTRVGRQVAREARQRTAGGFVSQEFTDHWRKRECDADGPRMAATTAAAYVARQPREQRRLPKTT